MSNQSYSWKLAKTALQIEKSDAKKKKTDSFGGSHQ